MNETHTMTHASRLICDAGFGYVMLGVVVAAKGATFCKITLGTPL